MRHHTTLARDDALSATVRALANCQNTKDRNLTAQCRQVPGMPLVADTNDEMKRKETCP